MGENSAVLKFGEGRVEGLKSQKLFFFEPIDSKSKIAKSTSWELRVPRHRPYMLRGAKLVSSFVLLLCAFVHTIILFV